MSGSLSTSTRVSILLPARNASETLEPCLRSIARQTLTSWECLVVDDGSTDGTSAVAAAAARCDPRFRALRLPFGGVIAALNEGLRHCSAPLIARMDADDVMHRGRLAAQVSALDRDATLAAVGCHVRIFPRRAMSPRMREYESWLNGLRSPDDVSRDAYIECPVAHPSLVMRREMAGLGYSDRGWPEDFDLILRALAGGMQIGVVPQRLLAWRDSPRRLSRNHPHYTLAQFTACRAHYLAAAHLAKSDRYILWGYGATGRALRHALAALHKQPAYIVEVKRTRIGQRIHGAAVIPPERLADVARLPIVVSVARPGPRAQIRAALSAMGFVEGDDYVCAA